MGAIERVTFKGAADTRSRTVWLRITNESDAFLSGIELRSDGEQVSGTGFDERLRIIDKGAISRRRPASMNLHYGELEVIHA